MVQVGLKGCPDIGVFGVFDGHGGDLAAIFVEHNLIAYLENSGHYSDMLESEGGKKGKPDGRALGLALGETFMDLDEDMRQVEEVHSGRDESGSTGVVGVMTPTELVIANCGDSRLVLVRDGKVGFATEDHKPYNSGERSRIEKAGGVVEADRVNGDLASSRAFGDFMYKEDKTRPATEQLISVQPDVTIINRKSNDQFLIIACDGVWDVFTNEEAASFVYTSMKLGCGLGRCAELLIEESLERDSRDNISVIIVTFPAAPKELGTAKRSAKAKTVDDVIKALKSDKRRSSKRGSRRPPSGPPSTWVVDKSLMATNVPSFGDMSEEQLSKFGALLGDDWNEFDAAQHKLGIAVGMFPETSQLPDVKYLFWTTNRLTDNLGKLMAEICKKGSIVQHRESDHQYRYVPSLI